MVARDAQRYARIAGLLLVVSLFAGGFGESYVPEKLQASGEVLATANTLAHSIGLFRAGFAAYLLEAACDLALTAIFYVLLLPVSRTLAVVTLCFGLFGTCTFAVGEIFYYAAGLPWMDAHFAASLGPAASSTFTYLCLNLFGQVFAVFTAFYGLDAMLRGYLMFRSGYIPRWIGALLMLAGTGFVLSNAFVLFAPRFNSMMLVMPMMAAMLSLAAWLLWKGVRLTEWDGANSL